METQTCKQPNSGGVTMTAFQECGTIPFQQPAVGGRACTVAARTKAVERVILKMRDRLGEPFSLQEMAEIAIMSPYHFNRVFHEIVGIPPRLYLGALRLEAAKRLLLTTPLNVIDVCCEVGYDSLGTFTSRFTDFVGLPPTSFRQMAERVGLLAFASQYDSERDYLRPSLRQVGLTGRISAPEGFDGLIFVGLFQLPASQTRPVGCDFLTSGGEYCIRPVPDGQYYVMAAALNNTNDPMSTLLTDNALRGKTGPQLVQHGMFTGPADVTLREPSLIDPPIIVALPFLLAQRLAATNRIAV